MSLHPTSLCTEQDGHIKEAFLWRHDYRFRGVGNEHHGSRHEAERYTKWHTAHRERQTRLTQFFEISVTQFLLQYHTSSK